LLLDLFCGAGGAAMGYSRAGFDVVGVDINPQPRYPFEFWQADAITVLEAGTNRWFPGYNFQVIHASPPCQAYTPQGSKDGRHPHLIEPIRELLLASGLPYVIENVPLAPLRNAFTLCGSTFGLGVRRHRKFEVNWPILAPGCDTHKGQDIRSYVGRGHGPYGPGGLALTSKAKVAAGRKSIFRGTVEQGLADMGIDWMTFDELCEAIPPAYTEFIGRQLMDYLASNQGDTHE
jgi:DNA (cytosine-5)-methyltransferase 1